MKTRITGDSEWIRCPDCGSQDVGLKKAMDADKAYCRDCGNEGWLV